MNFLKVLLILQEKAVFHIFSNNSKTSQHILMTFSGNVGHGTKEKSLDFGGDHNSNVDPGIYLIIFNLLKVQKRAFFFNILTTLLEMSYQEFVLPKHF